MDGILESKNVRGLEPVGRRMILVIGAGWYGCHIAHQLLQHGYAICIVDQANTVFSGSSAKNQNRLHLGYHYPRSPATIAECQKGFHQFCKTYPSFRTPIPRNFYYIAEDSKTSVQEFRERFDHPGVPLAAPTLQKVHPVVFPVAEEYIDNEKAREYFLDVLGPHFRLLPAASFASVSTICSALSMDPTWILNCTYNQLDPQPFEEYELYCSLVYRIPSSELFAITIMDGPHFSIYPYKPADHLYTVTSVVHGVVWRGKDRSQAPAWTPVHEAEVRARVEAQVCSMLPTFPTHGFHSSFVSWKTKPATKEDDRSMRLCRDGNSIRIYGGKITGMFEAAERVLTLLKS